MTNQDRNVGALAMFGENPNGTASQGMLDVFDMVNSNDLEIKKAAYREWRRMMLKDPSRPSSQSQP